jgi:hypothetical protein
MRFYLLALMIIVVLRLMMTQISSGTTRPYIGVMTSLLAHLLLCMLYLSEMTRNIFIISDYISYDPAKTLR